MTVSKAVAQGGQIVRFHGLVSFGLRDYIAIPPRGAVLDAIPTCAPALARHTSEPLPTRAARNQTRALQTRIERQGGTN